MSNNLGWDTEGDWNEYWVISCYSLWRWNNKELHDDNFIIPYCLVD